MKKHRTNGIIIQIIDKYNLEFDHESTNPFPRSLIPSLSYLENFGMNDPLEKQGDGGEAASPTNRSSLRVFLLPRNVSWGQLVSFFLRRVGDSQLGSNFCQLFWGHEVDRLAFTCPYFQHQNTKMDSLIDIGMVFVVYLYGFLE